MHALLSGKWYSLLLDNRHRWAVDIFKIRQCRKMEFDRQTRVVVVKQAASVHGVVLNENYRTISSIKNWVLCVKVVVRQQHLSQNGPGSTKIKIVGQ